MEYVRGDIKIEFEDLGEGWSGDYDPDDPDDVALLRFTVYRLDFGEWQQVDDASYCTLFPADSSEELQKKALELLMDQVYFELQTSGSIKKTCEQLSWIEPSWVGGK
jgi:hypothetical protein